MKYILKAKGVNYIFVSEKARQGATGDEQFTAFHEEAARWDERDLERSLPELWAGKAAGILGWDGPFEFAGEGCFE